MSSSPLSTPHSSALPVDDGSAKRRRLLPQPPSEGKGLEKSMDSPNKLSLPDDIVYEILLRLPVKSLVRFKCVCKLWFSLFSDPNFAKSHFDKSSAPTQRFLYIPRLCFTPHFIDIDASFFHEFIIPTPNLSGEYFAANDPSIHFKASCRGLVLVGYINSRNSNLLLWNPSTGSSKELPYPSNFSKFRHITGLWYDEVTDDYLIVMLSMKRFSRVDVKFYLEIFSLRKNSWEVKQLQEPFPRLDTFTKINRNVVPLLFNGVIHWNVGGLIVCFDTRQMRFSEMITPHRNWHLLEVGGCLASYDGCSNIWVMKDYKVQSSWTKYCHLARNIEPIYAKKNGEMIGLLLVSLVYCKLARLNDKGVLLESLEFDSYWYAYCGIFQRLVYTETLFSPSCFISQRAEE